VVVTWIDHARADFSKESVLVTKWSEHDVVLERWSRSDLRAFLEATLRQFDAEDVHDQAEISHIGERSEEHS
jgi:hypothetical protein